MYKTTNQGFTLIEIAIVLVIIGLLLGGVLKGQEMITNAKIKSVARDFDGVAAAIYAYQDRYKALSGDDGNANGRWGTGVTNGNANGVLAGAWNSTNNANETRIFWQHLRNANLIPGPATGTSSFAQPPNSFNGIIGIEDTNFGLAGPVICMSNIDGANAQIIDTQIDDGVSNTGSLRANTATASTTAAASYVATTVYNLCRRL